MVRTVRHIPFRVWVVRGICAAVRRSRLAGTFSAGPTPDSAPEVTLKLGDRRHPFARSRAGRGHGTGRNRAPRGGLEIEARRQPGREGAVERVAGANGID